MATMYFNDKTRNMTNGNNTPRAMDIEQVREYALSLYGVTEDQPFGDDNIVFRIEGKIFLCLWLGELHWDLYMRHLSRLLV